MKVFLSWSGERSMRVAEALKSWLPDIIQEIDPWVSTQDIAKGGRGVQEITNELAGANFGIVCITPENQASKWINYEAGALSKQIEIARVVPFLIDMKITDLTGPLAQFQATVGQSEEDVRKLLFDINGASEGRMITPDRLDRAFRRSWPELEKVLRSIRTLAPRERGSKTVERSGTDMLEEILLLIRQQDYRLADIEMRSLPADGKPSRSRRIDEETFISSSFAKIEWEVIHSSWEGDIVNIIARYSGDSKMSISRDFVERVAKSLGRTVVVMGESGKVLIRSSPDFP